MPNELLALGIVAASIVVAWALWPRRTRVGLDPPQHPPVKPAPLTPAQSERKAWRDERKRQVLEIKDQSFEGRPDSADPEQDR